MFSFFPREQEGRTGPVWGGWHLWKWGGYKERVWEGEMVEYYVHMYENGKMRPVETFPGMGGGGDKGP
jgi:hypothetical protein